MELKDLLSKPIGKADIDSLVRNLDDDGITTLFELVFDSDKRTSDNAAWVLTHIHLKERLPLISPATNRERVMEEAMRTGSITKGRLLLRLLEDVVFEEEDVRTDFLDFCLAKLADPEVPCGVRSLCMKLAYSQCRHWPELLDELKATLLLIEPENLLPGLRHAREKMLKLIAR